LKNISAGQILVKDDCIRFNPIKAVNNSQYGDTNQYNKRDTKIIIPANSLTEFSKVIVIPYCLLEAIGHFKIHIVVFGKLSKIGTLMFSVKNIASYF